MVANVAISSNWGRKKTLLGTNPSPNPNERVFIMIENHEITLQMYIWQNPNVYLNDKL